MPVVWSERHRGHAPDGGYWLGVRIAGDEEPERGDLLRDDLAAAGAPHRRGARPGARADPRRARRGVRRLPGACAPRVGRRRPRRRPRSAERGALHLRPARLRRPPPHRPSAGHDPRRDRAVRHRHDDAHQRGHVRGRGLGGALLGRRRRPGAGRRPRGLRRGAAPGPSRGAGLLRRQLLLQQRGGGGTAAARRRARASGHRRHRCAPGQRHPGDLLASRRRAVRQCARRSRRGLVPAPRRPCRRDRRRRGAGRHVERAGATRHR